MSMTVTKTGTAASASAGILVQLPATIAATQIKIQGFVEKATDALEAAEARATKLEAELIAAKAQHAADKATADAHAKKQQDMIDTLQKTLSTVLQRLAAVEDKAQHIRPAVKVLVRQGHVDLDYPGKREDLILQKSQLEQEITKVNKDLENRFTTPYGIRLFKQKLISFQAELARIDRYLEENKEST